MIRLEADYRAIYRPDLEVRSEYLPFFVEEADDGLYFVMAADPRIRYEFAVPFVDDDWILDRFTGRYDKHGTKIYEGDRLYSPYEPNGVVAELGLAADHWLVDGELEVIGNIYSPDK